MKFDIKNRLTGAVQFTAEIDCDEDANIGVKLGLAVRWGISNDADLRYADLRYADLSSADLSSADLNYADLSSADLSSADLSSADLNYADLRYADLSSADLSSADLRYADLSSADLRSADLRYAKNSPLVIYGLHYEVQIRDEVIDIGCESHNLNEWEDFTDSEISDMDGSAATEFWSNHKTMIIDLAKSYQAKIKPITEESDGQA